MDSERWFWNVQHTHAQKKSDLEVSLRKALTLKTLPPCFVSSNVRKQCLCDYCTCLQIYISCCTQWHFKQLHLFWHSAQKTRVLHNFQGSCQCILAALLFSFSSAPGILCVCFLFYFLFFFYQTELVGLGQVGIKHKISHKSINVIVFHLQFKKKKTWR